MRLFLWILNRTYMSSKESDYQYINEETHQSSKMKIVYVFGREMLRTVAENLFKLGQLSRSNIKETRSNSCIGTEYM